MESDLLTAVSRRHKLQPLQQKLLQLQEKNRLMQLELEEKNQMIQQELDEVMAALVDMCAAIPHPHL